MRSTLTARGLPLALLGAVAASACLAAPGHEDGPAATDAAPLTLLGGGSSQTIVASDGHPVDVAACGADPNCATDVPMTGTVSPLFSEVDDAVRKFMKTQCVGSGVLAISYKGRRVYKRGFGRMHGSAMETQPAHCQNDVYVANSDYVLPDTDVNIGSVSKFVTGSMVRDLVQERIVERGLEAVYPDPTQALLLDPDLELLPPKLLRYLDQTRPDAECPPVAITDVSGCTRAGSCGGSGPDVRWQNVTVGDLLAHTAALPRSSPTWIQAVTNAATLRGHKTASDFDTEEHQVVRATTPYQPALDDARQYLADTAGVNVNDVYFVNPWNRNDPTARPLDEVLSLVAGRCLRGDVNPAGQSDTNPAGPGPYSNTGFAILERIVTHLHPAQRFSADDGLPATQEGSIVDLFLEQEGIETGVQHEHAMFTRQKMVSQPGGPERRQWSASQDTYTWKLGSWIRPFCVWDGASCDFSLWTGGCTSHDDCSTANDIYRLPLNFQTNEVVFNPNTNALEWTNAPPLVPFELPLPTIGAGTGNLAIEAPALLALMRTYYVGVNNDVRMGRRRSTCATCSVTALKGGDAGGTYARAMSLVGGLKSATLPPLTPEGTLTIDPDVDQWSSQSWTDASDVDFIVSIHQDADEQGGSEGYALASFVRYALSRVDWDAVDHMIDKQRMNVVAVGISGQGRTFYWFENDERISVDGVPRTHDLEPAPLPASPWLPLPEAGSPGGDPPPTPGSYELPSTRNGSDVVAMAITDYDRVYAWYDDGHRSAGRSWDLSDDLPAEPYTVPASYSYRDIVDIGITSGSTVATWFKNGKMGFGTSTALATSTLWDFTVPPGQTIDQITGMAIDKSNDHTYTVFKDGSVAEGTYYDLDAFSYRPGDVVGMDMLQGNTSIWYRTGYRKDLEGTPADNRLVPTILPSSGYYRLPAGYAHGDVAGVGRQMFLMPTIWFANGARSTANARGDFITVGAAGSTTFPPGQSGSTLLDVAFAGDGTAYSWYNTGIRGKGTSGDLGGGGTVGFSLPPGQHELEVDAVGIDAGGDGFVWTLFRDGAIARGRSWELGSQDYWPTPHINPLP